MRQQIETGETTPINASHSVEVQEVQTTLCSPLQDEELAELTACIEAARSRDKTGMKSAIRMNLYYVGVCTLFSLAWFGALLCGIVPPIWMSLLFALGILLGAVFIGNNSISRFLFKSQSVEHASVRRLMEMDDVRTVAPLIDAATTFPDKTLNQEIWQALGRLLPRLTAAEAQELGKERHTLLAAWIRSWDDPNRRAQLAERGNRPLMGILHVLAHVGKNEFQLGEAPVKTPMCLLPILEKWAEGRDVGQDPAVQAAAQACRDAILQKMALAKSGEHLLRASAPTHSGPDVLLRPAQSAEQTDPQELLRPNTSE